MECSLEEVAFQVTLEMGTFQGRLEKSILMFKGWQVGQC